MVTNRPEEVRRLPDDAFASHAKHPNPAIDQHVAFPDDPAAGTTAPHPLPQTAWAPRSAPPSGSRAPQQLPPELAQIPPEVTAVLARMAARMPPRHRRRGRLSPAGLGLAAVVALALIMSENSSVHPDDAGTVVEQGQSTAIELRLVPEGEVGGMQPVEQPRYEIPLGPSRIRIEVVSDDPAADVVVTSSRGDAQLGEVALPFAAEFDLTERPDQLAVTARNRYGTNSIQCRVYADDALVSIATGVGLVECAAQPAR